MTATDGHPFWIDDQRSWVNAEDLEVGDRLRTADGSTALVSDSDVRSEVLKVYNLTVDGIRTFYAGIPNESFGSQLC
ncbi:polymorphic toxin-type HINT domain-containing protein [Umezawaea beigongshangensis]|uniref:polymorphic toxin-type HINT domain-containing protein n=1 Tax=Umezawaea beigongshangensis TaxID=2780383 RepID=UPI0018F12574|nr:polymorphic toxin-type HINT domain-containing protein [Umezawaea beigongshangensis]